MAYDFLGELWMSTSTENDKIGHEAPERGLSEAMLRPSAREKFLIFPTGNLETIYYMAGAAGFEPTDAEFKTRCLTTWRRP